jgi:phosphoribosylaminoimidazole-succinocarboxamide synthase
VRDVYELGDRLLLVATDRISAFDWVLPTGIPDKGRILTALSAFWFEKLGEANHLISTDVDQFGLPGNLDTRPLVGRSTLVRKARVVPIECVVRGYLSGSGWKEYRQSGMVCGVPLPQGLGESDRLPESIFTPATKAESGHDENIAFNKMVELVGQDLSHELRRRSIALYERAAEHARKRGILIADTKFEWGVLDAGDTLPVTDKSGSGPIDPDRVLLIDEALTPDSSRFWPTDGYRPGRAQPSFDKQFVRDYLETLSWNKQPPGPSLPSQIIQKTRSKYLEAYEKIVGKSLL